MPQFFACTATASFDYADFIASEHGVNLKSASYKASNNAAYMVGYALRLGGPSFSGYRSQLANALSEDATQMSNNHTNALFGKIARTCRAYGINIIILPLPKQP